MTKLRNILRGIVATLLALFLTAALLLQLSFFQRATGGWIAGFLQDRIGVPVRVGSVQLGLNGRIVVTDLKADDRRGRPLLRANRVAARLSVWSLLKGRVRIGNVQLIGLEANLLQERADSATNFQFIIDAFSSKSDGPSQIDLRIGQVVVRRAHVSWNQQWKPETPGRLNTGHIDLSQLNATLQVDVLRPDSLSIDIRRLDAREQSGLIISKFKAQLTSDYHTTHLNGFLLEMPHTHLKIPRAELTADSTHRPQQAFIALEGRLSTADLIPLYPPLHDFPLSAALQVEAAMCGDTLTLNHINLQEDEGRLGLTAGAQATGPLRSPASLKAQVNLDRLYIDPALLSPLVKSPLLNKVGRVEMSGSAGWDGGQAAAQLDILTELGAISVDGRRRTDGYLDVEAATDGLLFAPSEADSISIPIRRLQARATLKGHPDGEMSVAVDVPLVATDRTELQNVLATALINLKQNTYQVQADVDDPNLRLAADVHFAPGIHTLRGEADVRHFNPHALGLTAKREGESFGGRLTADIHGTSWPMAEGIVELSRPMHATPYDTLRPGNLRITSRFLDHQRRITLFSPWLEAQLTTRSLTPQRLVTELRNRLAAHLPTLISHKPAAAAPHDLQADFQLRLFDATPLNHLFGTPLQLGRPLEASVELDADSLGIRLDAPDLTAAGHHLQATGLTLQADALNLTNRLTLQHLTQGAPVSIALNTVSRPDGSLLHSIRWDNNAHPSIAGSLNVISRVPDAADGHPGLQVRVLPSTFALADSLWHIHPSQLSYRGGTLSIDSLSIAGSRHSIRVHGTASQSPTDTLYAEIRNLDIRPIFDFVNFHSVDFTGEATGTVAATRLFAQPRAEGWIRFPQLCLNDAPMGHADIYMNWNHRPKSIYLDAVLTDMDSEHTTLAAGYITPAKTVPYHGLDLDIRAGRTNIAFINKYTASVFSRLTGRASGHARLYGPFKTMQLEGDLQVEDAELGVPFTGTTYRIPQDSIHLRPGHIRFRDVAIYDPQGTPGRAGHRATVSGDLTYTTFSRMHYDVSIHATNILGYNFPTQGSLGFWGQVWADGDVNINGEPGRVDINIKATPLRPTRFTYNLSSPDYMMENRFVHYDTHVEMADTTSIAAPNAATPEESEEASTTTDMHINFDLDVTPQARLSLLMDAKSGDRITVEGDGRIRASYYNKGGFEMFGTYRIARGDYGLTLQNIIRKDFRLQEGGTVTFSGNPSATQLNVTATHTVSGVSLNDLSTRATFSNASARVNCIMNVTGRATQPHLDFDLDILNVNDDEKQMIRSLISTEEERNMQVIYLLGIGRFYTFDYRNTDQSQTTVAMNSLLSSTLSGQLNQMFQSIIGQRNWNVGANLSTGETGWSDLDIEGTVQGSLLDNRLLINGNFGYRDTPTNIKQNNFVGDFDIRYHLTPSGNVSLKAYSKTNDRYFTKSTLTTQGVGIRLGKDFKNLRDLFTTRRRRRQKSPSAADHGTPYSPALPADSIGIE